MNKYFIFVEGKNDLAFIRDYIKHISSTTFSELSESQKNKSNNKELKMEANGLEINLRVIDGDNLDKQKTKIKINHSNGIKNIIILDTDTSDEGRHAFGGYKKRKKRIAEYAKEWAVPLPNFLIPNDKDEGNIETLFSEIKTMSKWTDFNNCYSSFCNCINKLPMHTDYFESPKTMFYTYIMLYEGSKKAKEEARTFIKSDLWSLDNEYLTPLKLFLQKEIPFL